MDQEHMIMYQKDKEALDASDKRTKALQENVPSRSQTIRDLYNQSIEHGTPEQRIKLLNEANNLKYQQS